MDFFEDLFFGMFFVVHTGGGEEFVGLVGEDIIEEGVIDFVACEVGEAAHDDAGGVLGVGLSVEEGEGGTPTAAGYEPFLNAEDVGAYMFNILEEVLGGILFKEESGCGVTAAALVKADEAIFVKVVEGCDGVGEAVTGTAVKVDDGVAIRVAV